MTNGQHRPVPHSNHTSLAAAMAPHYRAAMDMVECLQIRHALGLLALASTKAAIAMVDALNIGANVFLLASSSLPTAAASNSDCVTSVDRDDGCFTTAQLLAVQHSLAHHCCRCC